MPDSTRAGREPVTGPAPGRLEHVRAFVNTLDIEAGTDELDSPAAIAAWLRSRELIPGPVSASAGDLRRAVGLREALREVLAGHVGAGHRAGPPLAGLRAITDGLAARLEIGDDGAVRTAPAGGGAVADGLAALMLIAAEASTLGTWQRLKVCSADGCRWAFYDRSPARTGCWCSMAVCGSRAKSRAFRQRSAAAAGLTGPPRA